jgi:hypothetical protein
MAVTGTATYTNALSRIHLLAAASASLASCCTSVKSAEFVWPMNSPSATKALIVATAPDCCIEVGRMIETAGNPLRNGHGSGMIRLVWKSSEPDALRSGNTRGNMGLAFGSVRGARGIETAFPALSCQVWKCMVSVGPILSRIRKTTGLVTPWAKVG